MIKNIRPTAVIVLALLCCHAPMANADKDSDWNKVIEMQEEALRRKEVGAPHYHVRNAFVQAAIRLKTYVRAWVPNKKSDEFLRCLLRSGRYCQSAGFYNLALRQFDACLRHELIERGLLYKPNELIKTLALKGRAECRSKALRVRLEDEVHFETRIEFNGKYHGPLLVEGAMNLDDEAERERFIETLSKKLKFENETVDAANESEISLRLYGRDQLQEAKADNLARLQSKLGIGPRVHSFADDGIVVYSINGSPTTTENLSRGLVSMRQQLQRTFFDSELEMPILTFYVNLHPGDRSFLTGDQTANSASAAQVPLPTPDNEREGAALSKAVHNSVRTGLTGYYEPLDNSILLRFGVCDDKNNLFLGSAQHELVHSFMQYDFPQAPVWLNEGVAALYEQTDDKGPADNHRLAFLRGALQTGQMPGLAALLDPENPGWRDQNNLLLTAAARYFCIFLWEGANRQKMENVASQDGNMLRNVYRKLRDSADESDATSAAKVLESVTDQKMTYLEAQWLTWLKKRCDTTLGNQSTSNRVVPFYLQVLSRELEIRTPLLPSDFGSSSPRQNYEKPPQVQPGIPITKGGF